MDLYPQLSEKQLNSFQKRFVWTALCLLACLPGISFAVQVSQIGVEFTDFEGVGVTDGTAYIKRGQSGGLYSFYEVRPDNSLALMFTEDQSIRDASLVAVVDGNAVVFVNVAGPAFYWVARGGAPQRISPVMQIPSRSVAVHNDRVLFFGITAIGEGLYAWPIGSANPASEIADLRPDNLISSPGAFLGASSHGLLFGASSVGNSFRLWTTDGTSANTALVPTNAGVNVGRIVAAECSGKILFGGRLNESVGVVASDGTAAGTALVAPWDGDYPHEMRQFSNERMAVAGRTARMVSCTGGAPIELSPPDLFGAYSLAILPQGVVFSARVGFPSTLDTLWFGPGDRLSTQVRADVFLEQPSFHTPNRIGNLGRLAFFRGTTDTAVIRRFGLWQTDGTAGGTIPVPGAAELVLPFFNRGFVQDRTGALFFGTTDGSWVIRPDAQGEPSPIAVPVHGALGRLLLMLALAVTALLWLRQR